MAEKDPLFTETLETPAEELATGSTFAGRYQIIEEIGRGGMGRVYRAVDKKLNEEVALKLIRPEIVRDERTLERFRNELKIARKISHRHVGRMYELMEEKGVHYITMEYVAGQDLRGLIRQTGQLTARKAISIAAQVLGGLAEAHRLGVVHRDLKPSNIIVDREGSARIIDFGIARTSETKGKTGEGAVIGTPEYMAPEQVEGKPADRRADLYALGAILFEMVTGRPPFEGETPLAVAVKHKMDPPPDPRSLAPQIPAELGRVILRSLEKERDKRYQTSEEFLADLAAIDEALPTTERIGPSRKPATSKKITVEFTPKKLVVPAIALAVLLVAVIFLWHPWTSPKAAVVPQVEHSIAVISFENLTGDPKHDGLIKAVPNLMITKFEAMGIPYVASWERLRDLLKQMGKDADVPIDQETGFEICRREGIAVLVTGEVTKAGNVFVTNLKALNAGTKRSLASASSQGQGEESILLSQIDDLAGRVHQKLGWALTKAGDAFPVAEFTTTSMDAYNEFLKGRSLYERLYYEEARQALQKAVDLDPGFASAHLYLAYVYAYLRNVTQETASYERAKAFSGKASEKERLYIEAAYANAVEKNPEKRLRTLQELTNKYPKEKLAHSNLGRHLLAVGRLPEAAGELTLALDLDPDYGPALNSLAYTYMEMDEFEKAAANFRKYAGLFPGDPNPHDSLGDLDFRMGNLDGALANFEQALKIKPGFGSAEMAAYVHAIKGEYREALRSNEKYILNNPSQGLQARGKMWRAYFYHVTGQRDLAMEEADEAIEGWKSLNPYGVSTVKMLEAWFCYDRGEYEKGRRFMLDYFDFNKGYDPPVIRINTAFLEFYLALLDVKQGRIGSAQERANKATLLLSREPSERPSWTAQSRNLERIVQAEIALAEGKTGEVIVSFKKGPALTAPVADPPQLMLHNMPFEQDILARAYQKAGNLDRAIEVYRQLLTFDPAGQDRRIRIPVYHYRLGRLCEEKGLKSEAAEQYRLFLDLWRDADPDLPEPSDAKKRLAGLK